MNILKLILFIKSIINIYPSPFNSSFIHSFHPGGVKSNFLITGSSDNTTKIWDINSGDLIDTIKLDAPVISIDVNLCGYYDVII